jgi:hypothetical protein
MIEQLNSILVSLHKFLFPINGFLFYLALIYSIVISFYYEFLNPRKLIQKKRIRNALFYSGFATAILFYSVLLNFQTPEFLSSLYIFIPLCVFLPTGLLVSSLWLAFHYNSKNKKYENQENNQT